jgi:tetratricopeptide (TPR) repeat protein
MKNYILFSLFFLFSQWSWCQDRTFGSLPLLQKVGSVVSKSTSSVDTTQYGRVLNIYNRLVQARGDFRYPVPKLNLSTDETHCAFMDYENLEIQLEVKALGVCNSFGNDAETAIAFLLAHELTHYYEKHGWRNSFAEDFKDLKVSSFVVNNLSDDTANETEADYLGGFLAYSAGYGLFDKGSKVIQSLYNAYGLKELLPGYPSLTDRQKLSQRTAEKIKSLVDVFEMANILTAIGSYPEAYEYYRYILTEYQSREIYNNLGVTALLDALQRFKSDELKYRYPIELDLESSGSKGQDDQNQRSILLQKAILQFDAAISLDPDYAPAYLNKAIAYALMGDPARARFYADVEARQAASNVYSKTLVDIDVLLGILEANAGNNSKAKAFFKSAADAGSALAQVNLKILQKQALDVSVARTVQIAQIEKIDGQSLVETYEKSKNERLNQIIISPEYRFLQKPNLGKLSKLYINDDQKKQQTVIHLTLPGYIDKTAKNIGIGDNRAAIIEKYGSAPKRMLETPNGQIMVYDNQLFILNKEGKLERWANYLVPGK